MMTYDKVRAIQQFRFGTHIEGGARRARRRTRAHRDLSELLGGLADGLAAIGTRGKGMRKRPAGPAY